MQTAPLTPRLKIAFESMKLSYSDRVVDLHNSGLNQILGLAAARGHELFHFRMADLCRVDGQPGARMSKLTLPREWSGNPLESYRDLQKTGELLLPLDRLDFCFLRGDDVRTRNTPNLDLLAPIDARGRLIESIKATLDTCDKYELLRRVPDVPQPLTCNVVTSQEALEALEELPKDNRWFVIKDRYGYGCGAQVHRIAFDDPLLRDRLEDYLRAYGGLLVQEYCAEVHEGDLVVTFFDDRLVGAMQRHPADGEWKTNASIGGRERKHQLTREQESIAWKVRRAFPDCRIISVDMFRSGRVLEVNAFPGAEGLLKTHDIVLGEIVLDQLERKLQENASSGSTTVKRSVILQPPEQLYEMLDPKVEVLDTFSHEHLTLSRQRLIELRPWPLDFIISVPHGGSFIPVEWLDRFNTGPEALIEVDLFSDLLFEGIGGAQVISRLVPYFVDMNRARKGADVPHLPQHLKNPPQEYYDIANRLMLAKPYTPEEESRVLRYYDVYHGMLARLIERMRAERGFALVLDAHSMTSVGLRTVHDRGEERDNFVVGTLGGRSGHPAVLEAFIETLRQRCITHQLDLSVAQDVPYSGGFITRRHAAPEQGIHVMQLEVTMDTYMFEADEEDPTRRFTLKAHRLREVQRIVGDALAAASEAATDTRR